MRKTKPILNIPLLLCVVSSAYGQNAPTVHQTATQSTCANIVALSGAKVDCSNLTPAQRKAIESIPTILKTALENQNYLEEIMNKLNEMSVAQPPSQTVNAPNGIGSIGGTLVNPTVNNFGPPPANLTFTEEVIQPLPLDGNGTKLLKIHIKTDRAIPGAIIGIIMSGPITLTKEFYASHNATQEGSGSSQVDISAPLRNGTIPIPNSFALKIGMPAAFYPGVDLAIVVESHVDVHVSQVVQIQQ